VATGTATTVVGQSVLESGPAQKILEVDFAGVQGDNAVTVRAVGSVAVEMPARAGALVLLYTLTNAAGGGAGDSHFGEIEIEIDGRFYAVASTQGMAYNLSGAVNPITAPVIFTGGNGPTVGPVGHITADALLGAANVVGGIHPTVASRVRIGVVAIHVGGPAGSANITAALWTVPYRGTHR
jgi:hypothetical protein